MTKMTTYDDIMIMDIMLSMKRLEILTLPKGTILQDFCFPVFVIKHLLLVLLEVSQGGSVHVVITLFSQTSGEKNA